MINKKIKNNRGFTLIETMVAVFILTVSVVSLMNVVTSSLFAAKYAKDEITVNYLLQEAIDYIRNDRDTIFLSSENPGDSWGIFLDRYTICNTSGDCYIDILSGWGPQSCSSLGADCTTLYYNSDPSTNQAFYTHDKSISGAVKSKYKREIEVKNSSSDEVDIKVTVKWNNGSLAKERTLKTSLLKWQY